MLTKSLVYEMSAMAMRWRLASSSVLNVDSMPCHRLRRLEHHTVAEQPVVFDQRRDQRLPALSPHRWPAGSRWWLQPPRDTSWEWTGAGRVQSVCTIKSVPFIGLDLTPSSRGVANRKTRTLLTFS